jgi:malonyl-CoA decarboxylase
MNNASWIGRNVSRLLPAASTQKKQPDTHEVKDAQARFAAAVGTADEAVAEVHYRRATVSPRRRLLQRFSVYPEGVRFLVELRAQLLAFLKADKRLMALDLELEYMFSTWFDVGFLELRRISWDSPASLIEKLIQYEAVHDIKSWADVKNRLDSDRRCYGFFHPRLPGVPLIFVEVALVGEMAEKSPLRQMLLQCAAHYLGQGLKDAKPLDPGFVYLRACPAPA